MKILKMLGIFLVMSLCATVLRAGDFNLKNGEKLNYSAKFLYIIPVGTAEMRVRDVANSIGHRVFLITCEAKTAAWLGLLFKAEAVLSSYVDMDKLYPYQFEQILKVAGKPDDIRRATYDRINNLMSAEGKGTKKVPADVRDPLSAIYYLRTQELKEGAQIKQVVNNNQSNYIFDSNVTGKKKIGKIDCWVMTAKIRRENKSMYHSMDTVIYVSADERRIPVLIQAKTKVGPVTLKFKEGN